MAAIRLQGISVETLLISARLLVQGISVSGDAPLYPHIRLTGITVAGEPAILSDIYSYTGTDWKPTPPVSWDGGEWK